MCDPYRVEIRNTIFLLLTCDPYRVGPFFTMHFYKCATPTGSKFETPSFLLLTCDPCRVGPLSSQIRSTHIRPLQGRTILHKPCLTHVLPLQGRNPNHLHLATDMRPLQGRSPFVANPFYAYTTPPGSNIISQTLFNTCANPTGSKSETPSFCY